MGEGLPMPLEPCLSLSLYSTSADVWFSASRSALSSELTEAQAEWKSPLLLVPEQHWRVQSQKQGTSVLIRTITANEFISVTLTQTGWLIELQCLVELPQMVKYRSNTSHFLSLGCCKVYWSRSSSLSGGIGRKVVGKKQLFLHSDGSKVQAVTICRKSCPTLEIKSQSALSVVNFVTITAVSSTICCWCNRMDMSLNDYISHSYIIS